MVSTATFASDAVKYLRDKLESLITDPISASRISGSRFVMTSYPQKKVQYPIITVQEQGSGDIQRLGMQSEETAIRLKFEIRVWARNVKEKDELFEKVYNALRENQFTGAGESNSSTDQDLHDFKVESVTNVDEDGEEKPKSKVLGISYMFITT